MRPIPSLSVLAPALVLLASCVGPAPQRPGATPTPSAAPSRPAPAPSPQPAQPVPVATEWQYRAVAPGAWTYRPEAAGAIATFGAGGADARLTIGCDRASRRISLARSGAGQGAMTVRTSYGATSWPAVSASSGGAVAQIVAFRAASDPVLDQIAYSRGKFAVEVAGQEMLIVPAWAEVARVIEDCRG
ncbi:hypothetical protein Q4610_11540 [Sphingobium sp. HBC34]|uniref:Lipoprotein n=1 Tax=Sphingobium cyanobacteriorum TaxID=3063954 RepID=A0ABT8ZPI3_9SPHN|nr:hypothetical protein [Sphingobium sp. HBC34]MDO7835675.1 hypothetical protein [Sphingobium sp. HBC34]